MRRLLAADPTAAPAIRIRAPAPTERGSGTSSEPLTVEGCASAVGVADGSSLTSAVGDGVGEAVADGAGATVLAGVGATVLVAVGFAVGLRVGGLVGLWVGVGVEVVTPKARRTSMRP